VKIAIRIAAFQKHVAKIRCAFGTDKVVQWNGVDFFSRHIKNLFRLPHNVRDDARPEARSAFLRRGRSYG